MKLALKLETVGELRRILGFILTIRKNCIFKFKQDDLNIISTDVGYPMIWGSIGKVHFTRYDVVAKDGHIGMHVNVEPIFQILKNFEKSPSTSELSIKLQRSDESVDNSSSHNKESNHKRRSIYLAFAYNEDISPTTEISHSFNIPVSLVRSEYLERIELPKISKFELIVDLNQRLNVFYSRIERYKGASNVNIVLNRLGELKIELQDDRKKMSIKWKDLLETYKPENIDTQPDEKGSDDEKQEKKEDDLDMIKEITINVRTKWWNISSKLLEFCETLQMYIHENGCVFNCHVEGEQSCVLLYYLPGKLLE